jgi:diguanylate cyclase (GGDEF)-like protein
MTPAFDPAACLGPVAWSTGSFSWLILAVAGGMAALAIFVGASRPFPGRLWLLGVLGCAVLWLTAAALSASSGDESCRTSLLLLQRPGMMGVPALWTAFLLQYASSSSERQPTWHLLPTLGAWLALSLAVLSNGAHGLFFGPPEVAGDALVGAPLFRIARVWAYLMLVAALVIVVRQLRRAAAADRLHWWGFLAACTVPWLLGIAHHAWEFTIDAQDPTPLGLLACVLFFVGLARRRRVFELAPHARNLLFDALADPLVVLDHRQRIVELNRAARTIAAGDSSIGLSLHDWPPIGPLLARQWQGGSESFTLTVQDKASHFDVHIRTIGQATQPTGYLLHLHDVTEQVRHREIVAEALRERESDLETVQKQQAQLLEASRQDPLTGLHNRRALQERYDQESTVARHTGMPLTLAMIDIDRFKLVNDNFGHVAGDRVLRQLADHLQRGVRTSDAVFRIGGEEFVILLPGASLDQARNRVEQLRAAFGADPARLGGCQAVTFSAGLAEARGSDPGLDRLLERADRALYRAKSDGRDCVRLDP